MYAMAALLVIAFIANWAVGPVREKHHMAEEDEARVAGGGA
jgi:hypothetical protein